MNKIIRLCHGLYVNTYLWITKNRMLCDTGEKYFHHIVFMVQSRNGRCSKIRRQIPHVSLQFGKSCVGIVKIKVSFIYNNYIYMYETILDSQEKEKKMRLTLHNKLKIHLACTQNEHCSQAYPFGFEFSCTLFPLVLTFSGKQRQ